MVFTRDGQRQQDYEKLDFDVLKQRTERVRLNPGGFSSMVASMKRALDEDDDDSSAKRAKH